jgi:hypothetical protein
MQNSGEQGVAVDLFGRKFMSGEVILLQMIQPNGTIINLQPPPVSPIGNFQMSIDLTDAYQVGDYTFLATSGNGHSVSTTFNLKPKSIAHRGFAIINISNPVPAVPVQGQTIQLQGKLFEAGEQVTIHLLQLNGVVRTLDHVQANDLGEFTVDLPLSYQLPTGAHKLLAISDTALAIVEFQLNVGSSVVPSEAVIAPITAGDKGLAGTSPKDGGITTMTPPPCPTTCVTPTATPPPCPTQCAPPVSDRPSSDEAQAPCSIEPNCKASPLIPLNPPSSPSTPVF